MGLLDCKVIVTQSCLILCDPMDCSPLCPWNSPGNKVGCHFLLQGNLPNPGIEPRSPTLQADSLATEPPEKPSSAHGILQARILEWVAITFSRESSQPRDGIQVSLIAGKFFANWAAREFPYIFSIEKITWNTNDPYINGQQCNTLKFSYLIPANIHSSRLRIRLKIIKK